MEIMKLENYFYYYPNRLNPSLENINFSLFEGEIVLVLGKSGSGKSTLAKVLSDLIPEYHGGAVKGNFTKSCDASIIFQDPEQQIVMDTVERELAFSMENMGISRADMVENVKEIIKTLDIKSFSNFKTMDLSGGQKQKVCIGSALSMKRKILILDEPTSQLDPVYAQDIINMVVDLNEKHGYTIILVEQRVERCLHIASRVVFMEEGKIVFSGNKKDFVNFSKKNNLDFLPPVSEFFISMGVKNDIPVTVEEGRKLLESYDVNFKKHDKRSDFQKEREIIIRDLSFSYGEDIYVLEDINMDFTKGTIVGIMGENGSGKSTLLKNIASLVKPNRGYIEVMGKVGFLSQNPNDYLFSDTVREEIKFTMDLNQRYDEEKLKNIIKRLDLENNLENNPRDLSGGERQRVAIGSVLAIEPDILILDEPTRGLDRFLKRKLNELLLSFAEEGKTVIIVTHDIEFCAATCDKVAILAGGRLIDYDVPTKVFSKDRYYRTQISRLFDNFTEEDISVTLKDASDFITLSKKKEIIDVG